MRDLSRKDLQGYTVYDTGYGTVQNIVRSELVEEIGNNSGVYGWNWTAYRVKGTNAIILDSYRNGLRKWFDNFLKVRDPLWDIDRLCAQMWNKTEEEKAQILKDLQNLLTD